MSDDQIGAVRHLVEYYESYADRVEIVAQTTATRRPDLFLDSCADARANAAALRALLDERERLERDRDMARVAFERLADAASKAETLDSVRAIKLALRKVLADALLIVNP
jgi:hypothetical protein